MSETHIDTHTAAMREYGSVDTWNRAQALARLEALRELVGYCDEKNEAFNVYCAIEDEISEVAPIFTGDRRTDQAGRYITRLASDMTTFYHGTLYGHRFVTLANRTASMLRHPSYAG